MPELNIEINLMYMSCLFLQYLCRIIVKLAIIAGGDFRTVQTDAVAGGQDKLAERGEEIPIS